MHNEGSLTANEMAEEAGNEHTYSRFYRNKYLGTLQFRKLVDFLN